MKRLMRHTAVVLGTLLLLILLWQFRLIVLLFALSLFVAAAIRPFVEVLGRRGLSETLAQVLLYVVGLGGLLLLLVLLGDLLLLELNDAANRAVLAYESLHRQWQAGSMWQQTLVEGLPPPLSFAGEDGAEIAEMLPVVVTATRGLAGAIGGLLLLLALSVYWSVDQYRFERLWLSLLPATRRAYMRDSWRRIETAVGAHLRAQAAQSVLVGLFLGVGALVVGATFPLLLAFFGALAALVPLFGGVAAALFAFGVGSVAGVWVGVGLAVYALLVFWAVHHYLAPRWWPLQRRSFLLLILVIIPLQEAFGLWGLIVAPPLALALEIVIRQTYAVRVARGKTAVRLDDLEARCRRLVQEVAAAENGAVTPELRSLTERLVGLLGEVKG